MEMKGIIVSAIVILVGCVLIVALANINSANINRQTQAWEVFSVTATTNYSLFGKSVESLIIINNTNATVQQKYNFTIDLTNGQIALNATDLSGKVLYANYTYFDRTYYINDSTSRALIPIILIMFVLAPFAFVAFIATDGFRDFD